MRVSHVLLMAFPVALVSCQKGGPSAAELTKVAQYYVDNGGLSLHSDGQHNFKRPCLRGINLDQTLLGGFAGGPREVVDFIEQQNLGQVTRTQRPSGYVGVTIAPNKAENAEWVRNGEYSFYCFGRWNLLKAERVKDAQAVTAGGDQPYLIAGTNAYSTRLTFKLDDLPSADFVDALKASSGVLEKGAMQPADYGQEFSVVALLPDKTENFNVTK